MLGVFIADDSLGFGTLAAAWLEGYEDIDVLGTARTATEAIARISESQPDVVLLDRLLPQPENSEAVLSHVRAQLPDTAILLVSGMPPGDLAKEARVAQADGHVSKAVDADGLADAVRRAAAGRAAR
jgi:two-component system, NarL family, response regulator DevR